MLLDVRLSFQLPWWVRVSGQEPLPGNGRRVIYCRLRLSCDFSSICLGLTSLSERSQLRRSDFQGRGWQVPIPYASSKGGFSALPLTVSGEDLISVFCFPQVRGHCPPSRQQQQQSRVCYPITGQLGRWQDRGRERGRRGSRAVLRATRLVSCRWIWDRAPSPQEALGVLTRLGLRKKQCLPFLSGLMASFQNRERTVQTAMWGSNTISWNRKIFLII